MWGGKIALFGKALVLALARGALTMWVMWVGFPFFFCGWEKNKFLLNLHCPVKKLNPFLFQFILVVSFCSSVALTLVANGHLYVVGRDFELKSCQSRRKLGARSDLSVRKNPRLPYTICYSPVVSFSSNGIFFSLQNFSISASLSKYSSQNSSNSFSVDL